MSCDPCYNDVVLLLHLDGPNLGQTTFDNSASNHTIFFNDGGEGGIIELSTDQVLYGESSLFSWTDVIGDEAGSINAAYTDDFSFLTNEFTMEISAYWPSITDRDAVTTFMTMGDDDISNFSFLWGTTGTLGNNMFFNYSTDGSDSPTGLTVSWTPPLATWVALAIERVGDTLNFLVDGVLIGTDDFAIGEENIHDSMTPFNIGENPDEFIGQVGRSRVYFDEARITKKARYNGAYTIATEAFPDNFCEPKINLNQDLRIETLTQRLV